MVAVRSYPRRYRGLLAAPGPDDPDAPDHVIRRRQHPSTWSALEYTAHVADLLDHIGGAIRRITRENEPTLALIDNEARAVEQRYNELPLAEVLGWLDLSCADLASVLESTAAGDWTRIGHLPEGDRTALDLARTAVHEGSHHLRDVQRVLAAVRGRPPDPG